MVEQVFNNVPLLAITPHVMPYYKFVTVSMLNPTSSPKLELVQIE